MKNVIVAVLFLAFVALVMAKWPRYSSDCIATTYGHCKLYSDDCKLTSVAIRRCNEICPRRFWTAMGLWNETGTCTQSYGQKHMRFSRCGNPDCGLHCYAHNRSYKYTQCTFTY